MTMSGRRSGVPGKSVAVLMGGWSSEREVSLVSGAACAEALEQAGYQVRRVDVQRDLPALLAALTPAPAVVLNALHGQGGEDGVIQGVLEMLGVPYTHSGLLASAVAMDKPLTKRLLALEGVRVPQGEPVSRSRLLATPPFAPPYVLKPANEGSSVGVVLVGVDTPLADGEAPPWPFADDAVVLMEEYVPGRDLTVGVMNGTAMTVTEIRPVSGFYDYTAKYSAGRAVHDVPADLPSAVFATALAWAERAHRTLGCRGVSRSDFRWDSRQPGVEGLYFLETNTQPGMTPLSLVPEQAAYLGISFAELVVGMVEAASWRG